VEKGERCGDLKSSSFIFSASEFLPRLSVGGRPSELKHLSKITLWIAPKGRVEKIQLAMSSSFFPSFSPAFPEGKFLDVSGTKILILLLHALRNHLHQLILLSPFWFIGLEISTSTAESRWGLGFVYIISLFSCSFSYFSLLIYKYIFSP
jgi:hypothetical protein